jgi:hypothetical protein
MNVRKRARVQGVTDPDLFVSFLSVSACFDNGHDDVLSCHEGKFLGKATSDDFGINYEAF